MENFAAGFVTNWISAVLGVAESSLMHVNACVEGSNGFASSSVIAWTSFVLGVVCPSARRLGSVWRLPAQLLENAVLQYGHLSVRLLGSAAMHVARSLGSAAKPSARSWRAAVRLCAAVLGLSVSTFAAS